MAEIILKTGERIIPERIQSKEEYLIYLRHLFAYEFAKEEISPISFILEVGCGVGYGTNLISQNANKIIGLDIDQNTIIYASKKYSSENCVFQLYDGIKIPYSDNIFDAVVSFQVIEHIQDDINFVSEIHRVLKKNGIFILTTPNRIFRQLKPGQKSQNRFHIREYSDYELENLLKNKFSDTIIWGIRGNKEIQRIEAERIDRGLKIISLDPLNFRKIIPQSLKLMIIKILTKFIKEEKKDKENFFKEYDVNDYYVIKENLEDSLDLLGICKK